jgi:hypothetical protein
MRLHRANSALLLERERQTYALPETNPDELLAREDLRAHLLSAIPNLRPIADLLPDIPLPAPIGS